MGKETNNAEIVNLVSKGYDAAANDFLKQCNDSRLYFPIYHRFKEIAKHLSQRSNTLGTSPHLLLDIGCGNGVPMARDLIDEDLPYFGIDSSKEQIRLCRDIHKEHKDRFKQVDVTSFLSETPLSLVGALMLFADFHLCVDAQVSLYRRLYEHLLPGAPLLCTAMGTEWEGYETNWMGASKMFWSSHTQEWYMDQLSRIGYEHVLSYEHHQMFNGEKEMQVFMIFRKSSRAT
eukprot:Nk52_evm2s2039 gene=Nk52_evmTU2s2039